MQEAMEAGEWRVRSDSAQVVANFLRCHPKVAEVRYPGLTNDPCYREASSTLRGGFGPIAWLRIDDRWFTFEATLEDARSQVIALELLLGR